MDLVLTVEGGRMDTNADGAYWATFQFDGRVLRFTAVPVEPVAP